MEEMIEVVQQMKERKKSRREEKKIEAENAK